MNNFSFYGELKDLCKDIRERYIDKPFILPADAYRPETSQLWDRIEEKYKYGLHTRTEKTLIYCIIESAMNGKTYPKIHHIERDYDATCIAKYLIDVGIHRVGILEMPGMLATLNGFIHVNGWKVRCVDISYAGRFPQSEIVLEYGNEDGEGKTE